MARICTLPTVSRDALPGARVLPGRFNVVQMAIGVRKRAAAALPTVDEFVTRIRSDGTVQSAIAEAALRESRLGDVKTRGLMTLPPGSAWGIS
jgi:hypothetical protein